MDVRILITALATLVLVALCHAASDADQAVQIVGELDAHHSITCTSSPTTALYNALLVAVSYLVNVQYVAQYS